IKHSAANHKLGKRDITGLNGHPDLRIDPSDLPQNPLEYADSNTINRGGLGSRHAVLDPDADASRRPGVRSSLARGHRHGRRAGVAGFISPRSASASRSIEDKLLMLASLFRTGRVPLSVRVGGRFYR